jgi:hypothetical protein
MGQTTSVAAPIADTTAGTTSDRFSNNADLASDSSLDILVDQIPVLRAQVQDILQVLDGLNTVVERYKKSKRGAADRK